jgi:hypothetical protein
VLAEEAFDYYAQGDDDGELTDHDGSWLASQGGALPALVMPGDPEVGQVFYSEDIAEAGIVERDEILSMTEPAETPDGTVDTGLLLGATQPDGTEEATSATFSNPTTVDNPYFGVTGVDYRLYLGRDEGEPLRIEVAPTGEQRQISWDGGTTATVVSQFIETSGRDLLEIAADWFAQDDDGNVWYFGEDVTNYSDGRVADTDGSWIAGEDGPPGLIMPAEPTLGRRFNPENIPGLVFETVDLEATDATYTLGGRTLDGVLRLHETLDDGSEETKLYAPGYGNVTRR